MDSLIQPKIAPQAISPSVDPSQPPPAAPAPAPAQDEGPQEALPPVKLPEKLLRLPAMQALFAGSPPAISYSISEAKKNNSTADLIRDNKDKLAAAGIGFYRSLSGDIGVMFNLFHVHPEDVKAADRSGQLSVLAPPYRSVDHAVSKSGATNPVLHAKNVPAGVKPPTMQAPPQMAAETPPGMTSSQAVSPAQASISRQIMNQRLKNIAPQSPTSGPKPGAGRLLNQILTPAV